MIKIIITAGSLFIANVLLAQDDMPQSTWMASPVKIDGIGNEWPKTLRFYDNSTKLFFAFANDDKNLYICFQSPDEMNQVKIMRAGMKINLAVKTSAKHNVSIIFPIARSTDNVQKPLAENGGDQQTRQKDRKNNFLVENTLMEVKGFATRTGTISINDSSGINAAINWDENNKMIYEIAIPLKEFYGAGFTLADMSKPVSLDVEVNAVSNNHSYSGGGGGFGSRGGGRMGGGGGHRRGNAAGGEERADETSRQESRAAMFEKGELKEKFILASGKPK